VLSLAVGLLPARARRLGITWPGITMTLHEFSHRRLLESQLLRGLADVGVGRVRIRGQATSSHPPTTRG
jgi:hypothetical protein